MKLFQIEEPEGGPLEAEGPGVAVGIDLDPAAGGAVAVAVGGNAEILPGHDGERRLMAPDLEQLLLGLRERAEKQLARPVTHAVIAAPVADAAARATVEAAAAAAGMTVLRLIDREAAAALAPGSPAGEAPLLGAAIAAEDAAPQ